MKNSRFSREQIIHLLREAEGGGKVDAVCATQRGDGDLLRAEAGA